MLQRHLGNRLPLRSFRVCLCVLAFSHQLVLDRLELLFAHYVWLIGNLTVDVNVVINMGDSAVALYVVLQQKGEVLWQNLLVAVSFAISLLLLPMGELFVVHYLVVLLNYFECYWTLLNRGPTPLEVAPCFWLACFLLWRRSNIAVGVLLIDFCFLRLQEKRPWR